MTAKSVTISSDRIRPSFIARNLQYPNDPLRRSFKGITARQNLYVFLVLATLIAGLLFVVSQIEYSKDTNKILNATNSSDTNITPNQQPVKDTTNKPMTNDQSATNSSTSSSSNSTSVTVNGQPVNVPQSGTYDQTTHVSGNTVHVSGNSSQSSTGGSTSNNSSTNVEVNSE